MSGSTLSTQVPYKTYQWILNGQPINGATNAVYQVMANGEYQVAVTTDNDCPDTSEVFLITNVHVDGIPGPDALTIYPNPAKDRVFVAAPVRLNIEIVSVDGRRVHAESATNSISVRHLSPGVYFLKIATVGGQLIKTEKLIKE